MSEPTDDECIARSLDFMRVRTAQHMRIEDGYTDEQVAFLMCLPVGVIKIITRPAL